MNDNIKGQMSKLSIDNHLNPIVCLFILSELFYHLKTQLILNKITDFDMQIFYIEIFN